MFLTIKNIPSKSWSSEKPLNLKPKFTTFLLLCVGLSLFGLGEGLLLVSTTGNSPWSVLAEGLSKHIKYFDWFIYINNKYCCFRVLVSTKTKARNWNNFKYFNYSSDNRFDTFSFWSSFSYLFKIYSCRIFCFACWVRKWDILNCKFRPWS